MCAFYFIPLTDTNDISRQTEKKMLSVIYKKKKNLYKIPLQADISSL